MSVFASILVPLDGSHTAARSLGCAAWLAARLGARLHILSATPHDLPARAALQRLKVPEEDWPLITLHQAPADPEGAILSALARHAIDLVVMTACGQTAEAPVTPELDPARIVGHVTRAIMERSPVPVLLLPSHYREALPWQHVLVPVSGEPEADEALALAVRLAGALELQVRVAHVADADVGDEGLAARGRYADALYHEYPGQLAEFVSRALPHYAPEECRCIKDVVLCHGAVAPELLKLIEGKLASVLVVGWHGWFMTGRARVVKELIQRVTIPVLLVKPVARMPFRLEVGEEIQ